jgi:thiamine biosynthesis lipoprotein
MNAASQAYTPPATPLSSFGNYHTLAFNAMGTGNEVVFSAASRRMADAFRADLMDWLSQFESRISRYRPDSLVSTINRQAGGDWIPIDTETEELIGLCDWFHWKTNGVFDPSLGPLAELWDYKRVHDSLPSPAAVAGALERTGWRKAERKPGWFRLPAPGMSIDLGGIGKEYAVDKAIALARRHGIRDILVNFGRDIRAYGHPPEGGSWRVGLENPLAPDRCWTGVGLNDLAIAGSGTYARGFELAGNRYSHLLDPRSGYPAASGCAAAWVIAPTCTEAGVLSTTAAILAPADAIQAAESAWRTAACLWTNQGLYHSRRFHEYTLNDN